MPSASTKSEKAISVDPTEIVKQVLTIVDKKSRNLEKRKGKLDTYKDKLQKGDVLNADQKEALDRYGEVIQGLDLMKEMSKQFSTYLGEVDKAAKKRLRKEQLERQVADQKRIGDILVIQNLLDSMGAEGAREDFQHGRKGAVLLTEESLNFLDELYKLVSPSREGEKSFEEEVTASSEHLINLLERKDKEVIGTTYSNLADLLDKIKVCSYWSNSTEDEAEEYVDAKEEVSQATSSAENGNDCTDHNDPEFEVVHSEDLPAADSAEVAAALPVEPVAPVEQAPDVLPPSQPDPSLVDNAFFSTGETHFQKHAPAPRPFNEIVSSVKGKDFDFLQDSEIEADIPHVDPAIVSAHPMTKPTNLGHNVNNSESHSHQYSIGQDQSVDQRNAWNSNSSPAFMSQGLRDQPTMPQPIPMPGQGDNPENKPFKMNVNAAVFQSVYSQSNEQDLNSGLMSAAPSTESFDKGFDKSQGQQSQNDFQTVGYNNSSYNRSGNNYNNRGRGGRGGGNRGNMSNGYSSRGGGRGGSNNYNNSNRGDYRGYNRDKDSRGGTRGGQRGGNNQSRGRGGFGGNRPNMGYQGHSQQMS